MSLAVKYRPDTFDKVVEQAHIVDILKAQALGSGTHNNYLFFGPRGTGKTTSARLLAKALNACLPDGNPDNSSEMVRLMNEWKTLDFVEIDAASHTGVDNIREEIISKAPFPPTVLKKKIYIIDEVHMLSTGAFNALLKIMEEPPSYLCFILATTEIQKVPETIASRCQVFNFKRLHESEIVKQLEWICKQENFTYEMEALHLIAKIAEGGMRDAIKYLDQISILGALTQSHVSQFLGVASDYQIQNFLALLKGRDLSQIFVFLEQLVEKGVELHQFSKQVLVVIDEHFMEDMEFSVQVADMMKNILGTMRAYAYPLIVYKTEIYKMFHPQNISSVIAPQEKISKPAVAPAQPTSSVSILPVTPVQSTSLSTVSSSGNYESFQKEFFAAIPKASVRTMLETYGIVTLKTPELVTITVINEMNFKILSKSEIVNELEETLSSFLQAPTKLQLIYQKKEEYFASLI